MVQFLGSKFKSLTIKDLFTNLSQNWFIPISALFFFLINAGVYDLDVPLKNKPTFDFYFSITPAVLLILIISAVCPSFIDYMSCTKIKTRVIALISALGICFCTWDVLKSSPFVWGGSAELLRILFMFLGLPFAFVANLLFWSKFEVVISELLKKSGIVRTELIVYSALFLLFCIYIAFCFLKSNAFYEADRYVDVIYTSDSPILVKFNCFILLDHFENDLRQPFFAVFSAPLMGIPCLIGKLIPGIPMAVFIAFAQIIMMLFSAFLLAYELKLNPVQRICFVLISSFSYTFMLFAVMMEQYVVAVFWLILTIHLMNQDKNEARLFSYAASGTLLISGALVPFIFKPKHLDRGTALSWLKNMCLYCVDFIFMFIIAGRINLIGNALDNMKVLFSFTGEKISVYDRCLQYLSFVSGCFFAPETRIIRYDGGYSGWYLAEVTNISYVGIIIILLATLGFVLTRNNKISVVAFGWMIFSMLVLIGIGWGTYENGLILYALYFGWPFLVLIFGLFKIIEDRMRSKLITPLITTVLVALLLVINIPSIIDLITYAVTEYAI